jgi:growth factor-regulated tyrosine kinase substrate
MSEAEEKNRKTGLYHQLDSNSSAPSKKETKPTNGPAASSDYPYIYRGVATESSLPVGADEEDDIDPALSRYLDKRYWEQRQAARDAESVSTLNNPNIRATAPPRSEMSFSTSSGDPIHSEYVYPSYNAASSSGQLNTVTNGYALNETPTNIEQKMAGISLAPSDEAEQTAAFCKALREQVEIMDNRMRSNLMRGRSIVNDSAIHALFNQLTTRHADVLTRMNNLDKERGF